MTKATGKVNRLYGGRWEDNPAADEILYGNYGTMKAKFVANRINKELGTKFTEKAIYDRASYLGINAADCQGLLSISEGARQLGICRTTLFHYVERNKLETLGRGYLTFLTEDTWRICRAAFPEIPEPWITPKEAGDRLGFAGNTIVKNYICKKKLRGYKFGGLWRVALADVERMERQQKGLML